MNHPGHECVALQTFMTSEEAPSVCTYVLTSASSGSYEIRSPIIASCVETCRWFEVGAPCRGVTAPGLVMPTGLKRSRLVTRFRSSTKSVAFKGRSVQLLDRSIDVRTVLLDGLDVEPARCDPIIADRGDDDPTHGEG